MATFVVAHGAWSSAWAWKKMRTLVAGAGHQLFTPSYTGLGERSHLAGPQVDLDTHIRDVMGTLEYEDLHDVILVGHSYGGMVATGVADRARTRIARLVYLDAFVPRSGQACIDLLPDAVRTRMEHLAAHEGGGWSIPPNPLPADTSPQDVAWAEPKRRPHSIATLRQPLDFSEASLPPRSFISCTRTSDPDLFAPFAARARREGWGYYEIDASHNPHITAPEELLDVLVKEVGGGR